MLVAEVFNPERLWGVCSDVVPVFQTNKRLSDEDVALTSQVVWLAIVIDTIGYVWL